MRFLAKLPLRITLVRALGHIHEQRYYSTARLWDDGVIDPVDTRRVVGVALGARAPLAPRTTPPFRM